MVGAGPIGLSAILGAKLLSPAHIVAIDLADSRLEAAKRSGADVAIEAVGIANTFQMGTQLIRPGGRVANIGVHGGPATLHLESLHLESLWTRHVTITTGLVDTWSATTLLKLVRTGQNPAQNFVTHHFSTRRRRDRVRRVRPGG